MVRAALNNSDNPEQAADTDVRLSVVDNKGLRDEHDDQTEDQVEQENLVQRSIREITSLQREMHNLSENLVALGAPYQTINVLVEMGFNNKVSEQKALLETLFVDADGGNGVAVADRDKFCFELKQLVDYERDMANVRRTAREQGLKLPVVNALTQMIRRNPGDGGKAEINAFLAYALAYGVELDGVASVLDRVEQEPQSVLPQIDRSSFEPPAQDRKALIRDLLLGASLTVILLWLVL